MPDENKNNVVDVEKIKNSVVQVGHGAKNVILPAWSPIEYEIFSINLSDPSPIIALLCQSLHWVIQFLLFFRLDWCDPGMWGFMQPLLVLPAVVIFDSHIVEVGRNQKPCCWCKNKTKAMSLMQEQNKSHIVDVRRKPKPRWILFKLVFSKLLHGFL